MVCGFVFDWHNVFVLLIHKLRPDWQRRQINGIGGKIEHGETPLNAMIRECREETGLNIRKWEHFATVNNLRKNWTVYFYVAHHPDLTKAESLTDEMIAIFEARRLPSTVMYNLTWLIPLAIAKHIVIPVEIDENGPNG
jgi:8-oxo-dGTP diphosphatase